jgi:hypothetical protein
MPALPRLCCRGLIEARLSSTAASERRSHFRGIRAAASLKLDHRVGFEVPAGDFRGIFAAASLKRDVDTTGREIEELTSAASMPRPH